MKQWTRDITVLTKEEIEEHCVNDPRWQTFRLSLKGMGTAAKLTLLETWGDTHQWIRSAQVQVDNYINALKRGGQLNMNLEVIK